MSRKYLLHPSFQIFFDTGANHYGKRTSIELQKTQVYDIMIALFILGLETSNNLQQFKYKNDIKQ